MAFEQVGGVDYLVRLAQEDPKTFVPLLIKTLPPVSEHSKCTTNVRNRVGSKCTTLRGAAVSRLMLV